MTTSNRGTSFASLGDYLKKLESICSEERQVNWFNQLMDRVHKGEDILSKMANELNAKRIQSLFNNLVRTEELKAWYGTRDGDSLFQGTSISSLTIPHETSKPVDFRDISVLENEIADAYITQHDRYEEDVKNAIIEDTSEWRREGLFYGVVIASKVISQAFDLSVPAERVIFSVDGVDVDPHEITHYPIEIRAAYFEKCRAMIDCFENIEISRVEFESSLVLSDISKPKIPEFKDTLLLAPVKCNEICTLISRHVTELIREKTIGRIHPRSLMVTIYDTDTPYTFHDINGYLKNTDAPVLPGLVVLGSSGTIEAFRWLYAYRVSLIAQKMMKGSLCSEASGRYMPFLFFGVLVKRDADILLNMDDLGMLRYKGNISPLIEYHYMIPLLAERAAFDNTISAGEELMLRI